MAPEPHVISMPWEEHVEQEDSYGLRALVQGSIYAYERV